MAAHRYPPPKPCSSSTKHDYVNMTELDDDIPSEPPPPVPARKPGGRQHPGGQTKQHHNQTQNSGNKYRANHMQHTANQAQCSGNPTDYRGNQAQYRDNQNQYPGNQTRYPGNQNQHRGSQNQYPGNQTQYPGSQTQGSHNLSQFPGNSIQYPGNQTQYPGNQTQYPGNQTQYPGNQTQYPGNQTQYPGNQAQYPGDQTQYSDNLIHYRGNQAQYRGKQIQYPSSHTQNPGNQTQYSSNQTEYSSNQTEYPASSLQEIDRQTPRQPTGSSDEEHHYETIPDVLVAPAMGRLRRTSEPSAPAMGRLRKTSEPSAPAMGRLRKASEPSIPASSSYGGTSSTPYIPQPPPLPPLPTQKPQCSPGPLYPTNPFLPPTTPVGARSSSQSSPMLFGTDTILKAKSSLKSPQERKAHEKAGKQVGRSHTETEADKKEKPEKMPQRTSAPIGARDTQELVLSQGQAQQQEQESIHLQPWFWGNADREMAEALIYNLKKDGTFLVRNNNRQSDSFAYTLTVLSAKVTYHVYIRENAHRQFALGFDKDRENWFPSVCALIQFYKEYPIMLYPPRGESRGHVTLTKWPEKPPPGCDD